MRPWTRTSGLHCLPPILVSQFQLGKRGPSEYTLVNGEREREAFVEQRRTK
jgi:hypothetical protein